MAKAMSIFGMVVAALMLLVFGLDLLIGAPFGGVNAHDGHRIRGGRRDPWLPRRSTRSDRPASASRPDVSRLCGRESARPGGNDATPNR